MRRRTATKERGAVAVVVALCSVLILSLAALSVDLGNAFVRKRDLQSQADFSSLAGGANLPGTKSSSDPVVLAVVKYLNANQPQDDNGVTPVTASDLVDGPLVDPDRSLTEPRERNGEIYFESKSRIRVIAPEARVQFGLAGVIGFNEVDVNAEATVGVFSPGIGMMPAYAVSGCDWGPQVLTDPANGQVTPAVPVLSSPTDSNVADIDAPTAAILNPTPNQVDVNPSTPVTILLKGHKMNQVTQVGFFKEGDGVNPPPAPLIIPDSEITHSDDQRLSFQLPSAAAPSITAAEGLWWIRVWAPISNSSPTYQWSEVKAPNGDIKTVPFRVGNPYLQCVGASNQGNFGTLILARQDTSKSAVNGWMPVNIAAGLQPPLSLHTFDGAVDPTTGFCNPLPPNASSSFSSGDTIYTETGGNAQITDLLPDTNCVDTDTGLPANSVTSGLITWTGSVTGANGTTVTTGRLINPASPGCPTTRSVSLNGTGYNINDDTLTCFFTDTTATVGDVSNDTYTYNGGKAVISEEIYKSPRFFWVPVLKVKPSSGGSNHYAIIDFRPAFLTDQPVTATKAVPQVGPQNGVEISGNDVTQIKVVFLNHKAIEEPTGGPVMPWMGAGPKLLRLID